MRSFFITATLLTVGLALVGIATGAASGIANSNAPPVAGTTKSGGKIAGKMSATLKTVIFLVDYSESVKALEDTTQPVVGHCLKIAELSGEPVAFAVVFFGGDGVHVFPAQGGPTTAHKALHHDLLKHWPKPKGGTPLDAAMQVAVHQVGALPRGSDVTVVLFTDGEPSSGWLRPEAFPEVKAEVDRQIQAVQKNPKGYPPAIVQQLLARLEKELLDARSERCQRLYEIQVKAEFKKTLDHAQALKQAKVRFISVDYGGGIPALKQIHDAAGGLAADLVITEPAGAVARLHRLGLTSLPQVIVQDPKSVAADAKAFTRLVPLKLDAVGDRAVVTLVFEKPVGDFAKRSSGWRHAWIRTSPTRLARILCGCRAASLT